MAKSEEVVLFADKKLFHFYLFSLFRFQNGKMSILNSAGEVFYV